MAVLAFNSAAPVSVAAIPNAHRGADPSPITGAVAEASAAAPFGSCDGFGELGVLPALDAEGLKKLKWELAFLPAINAVLRYPTVVPMKYPC
jgi:hypothetical protein